MISDQDTINKLTKLAEDKELFKSEIEDKKMMIWEILMNNDIKIDIVDFVTLLPRIAPRL